MFVFSVFLHIDIKIRVDLQTTICLLTTSSSSSNFKKVENIPFPSSISIPLNRTHRYVFVVIRKLTGRPLEKLDEEQAGQFLLTVLEWMDGGDGHKLNKERRVVEEKCLGSVSKKESMSHMIITPAAAACFLSP